MSQTSTDGNQDWFAGLRHVRIQRVVVHAIALLLCALVLYYLLSSRNTVATDTIQDWRTDRVHEEAVTTEPAGILKTARSKYGYVLTKSYTGQQGSALSGLVTLQCWVEVTIAPVYVVEPFIVKSGIHAFPRNLRFSDFYDIGSRNLRFSDFYDIGSYNRISVEDGYAEITSWEDFLQNAPRNVIVVETHVNHGKTELRRSSHNCSSQTEVGQIVEFGFCVVRVVDAYLDKRTKQILSGDDMEKIVFGDWKPNNITLFFTLWSWHWFIGNNTQHSATCRKAQEVGLWDKLHPSIGLLRSAKDFEDQILGNESHPFHVAVMLRLERVVMKQNSVVNATKECMHKVGGLVDTLQKGREPEHLYVTSDITKYGSKTMGLVNETQVQFLGVIQSTLNLRPLSNGNTILDFDMETVTQGITDRGYIAALQRTIASRADCLILVGGGNFLKLALGDYLNFHPNPSSWCIHTVCMEKPTVQGEEFQTMFNQIMDAARTQAT